MQRKRVPYQLLLLVILTGFVSGPVSAQTPYDKDFWGEAAQIEEQVQLLTDRSIYAVEETIHFVAHLALSGAILENQWSNILYVELIGPTGKPMVQQKYLITAGRAEGIVHIPAEALTGDYYLRSYTRWMRNKGPGSFSYTPLQIINPFRSEVAAQTDEGESQANLVKVPYRQGVLECITDSVYQKDKDAVLRLKGSATGYPDLLMGSVTVVPAGAIDLSGQYIIESSSVEEAQPFMVSFLPDKSGSLTISGTVIGPDQKPVPHATLHFSVLGENPDYFATITDINGRFTLNPSSGAEESMEFFVTPEQEVGSGLEVRIDQEYDSRMLAFPGEQFQLSVDELEIARRVALNMQLSKAFHVGSLPEDKPAAEEQAEGSRIPFYGTRVNRLLIDDYVRLPNLEEVFINLVPEVQFYRKQGITRIKIISENSSIGVYYPLIMIDHISVFDHEAILALSPEKIERIDLIHEIYLKGNVAFGGVLAIHSKNGDMAGIDLPESSYFFDYQSFSQEIPFVNQTTPKGSRVPDTRNTHYWSGELLLEQGSITEISFRAPHAPGNYVVLLRGVSPDGEIFSASAPFRVE